MVAVIHNLYKRNPLVRESVALNLKAQLAIENIEKFLDLWKDADKDLPDLIDAKKRLAKLKEMSNKGS